MSIGSFKAFLSLSPGLRYVILSNTPVAGGIINRRASTAASSAPTTASKIARRWPGVVLVLCLGFVAPDLYSHYYSSNGPLDTKEFRPFILESKEWISPTCNIFNLVPANSIAVNPSVLSYVSLWNNSVWSVQIKQPQLQIARSYTPLPSFQHEVTTTNDRALKLLIRHEPKGEVSGYLHSLPLNSIIELRGPQIEYIIPNDVDEILFIAGGTGIAPALQVARHLFSKHHASQPRLHILWANRRREDCAGVPAPLFASPKASSEGIEGIWEKLIPKLFWRSQIASLPMNSAAEDTYISPVVHDLQVLKKIHADRFSVDCFVDDENNFIDERAIRDTLKVSSDAGNEVQKLMKSRRTEPEHTVKHLLGPCKKVILVSGPDGFVRYIAGPKQWQNGQEIQGELGGLLGKMDLNGWEVWKL